MIDCVGVVVNFRRGWVTFFTSVYVYAALFMVFDRGMGVVSLRSWKHPGHWLRVVNGELMGKVREREWVVRLS